MIGGVWHPAGVGAARVVLRSLGGELAPNDEASASGEGGAVVAAWGRASLDAAARAAVVGDASPLAGRLDFDAARGLRGTYALLAASESGLVLAKGVLGGHALYYRRLAGGVVAACSRASALARLGPTPPDLGALARFVASIPATDDRTVLDGVRRVLTCETMAIGRVTRRAARHTPRIDRFDGAGADEAADALFAQLERSVARVSATSSRVAVLTGGGVDSSALLASALTSSERVGSRGPLAVTLDFDGPGSDQPHFATLTAALGVETLKVPPRQAAPWLERALVLDGLPYVGACYDVGILVAAMAAGASAAMTGNFGDELFEGPMRAISAEVGVARAAWLASRLELPWDTTAAGRVRDLVIFPRAKPLVPSWLRTLRGRRAHAKLIPWAGPRVAAELAARRDELARDTALPSTPEERYLAFAHDARWSEVAEARAQIEQETGCARLEPFQDDELVALVASFSTELLMHGGRHRGLLRHALRGRVPDSVRLRRDKAWFEVALAEAAAAGGGLASLGDLSRFRRLDEAGIVRAAALREDYDRLCGGSAGDKGLGAAWSFVSLALAAEKFLACAERPAEPASPRAAEVQAAARVDAVTWTGEARAEGAVHFRVGRAGARYVAEWPGVLTLLVSPSGDVESRPARGADPRAVVRLSRGLGAALARHVRGELSLHASVVARGDRALAIVGESGAGKSTAAAALCARHGFELLCDDISPLTFTEHAVFVESVDDAHSLSREAARALGLATADEQLDGKVYVRGARRVRARLVAIASLSVADGGEVGLTRLRGASALAAIVDGVVRLVLDDPEAQRRELVALDRLCSIVPVWDLSRHEDLAAVAESVAPLARLVDDAASAT